MTVEIYSLLKLFNNEVSKMKTTIFVKEENDKKRYWISVTSDNKDGTIARASIPVLLSNEANNAIVSSLQLSKNPKIKFAKIKIKDGDYWFRAFASGTVNRVGIFINNCEVDNSTQQTL